MQQVLTDTMLILKVEVQRKEGSLWILGLGILIPWGLAEVNLRIIH
jgi:hypothetical protein